MSRVPFAVLGEPLPAPLGATPRAGDSTPYRQWPVARGSEGIGPAPAIRSREGGLPAHFAARNLPCTALCTCRAVGCTWAQVALRKNADWKEAVSSVAFWLQLGLQLAAVATLAASAAGPSLVRRQS